jgi:hypothetical protein
VRPPERSRRLPSGLPACTVAVTSTQMPSPPLPDPGSPVLKLIVTAAVEAVRSGDATAEQAILHAAVHGWYEDQIQGEDACPAAASAAGCPGRPTEADSIRARTKPRPGRQPLTRAARTRSVKITRRRVCSLLLACRGTTRQHPALPGSVTRRDVHRPAPCGILRYRLISRKAG